MSYSELTHLNTYHNNRTVVLIITAHDLLGNKMFEDQKLIYKIGQHVHFNVPQYDSYYIDKDVIDFCIQDNTNIDLVYKRIVTSVIHITDDNDKVVYCGKLYQDYVGKYSPRIDALKEYNNDNKYVADEYKLDMTIPCLFEGEQISFKYPNIETYYTNDQYVDITIHENIVLHKKYHKINPVTIVFIDENDSTILTISKALNSEDIVDGQYTYVVDSNDFVNVSDIYYSPKESETIYVNRQANNELTIKLYAYRYVHINNTIINNDSDTPVVNSVTCLTDKKYRVGEQFEYTIDSYPGYYITKKKIITKIPATFEFDNEHNHYVANIEGITYYKYLTLTVYCMYNGQVLQTETVTDLIHNKTYVYAPSVIPGYSTHVNYMYINTDKNKTLHIEYHANQ